MKRGEMLGKMLVIVTNAHAGQYDKGGAPYILHPLKVMHYLKSDDEELQCIALGHDVIEDTDMTCEYLRNEGISERVIEGIMNLTKMPGETYDTYKSRVMSSIDSIRVKMADLRHNSDIRRLKGVNQKDLDRIAKYQLFYMELMVKYQSMIRK